MAFTERRVTVDGATVRRPANAWTPTVHAFLRHLGQVGFTGASVPLGIDGDIETVSFLVGASGADCWPHQATDRGIASAARLLRRAHDASRGWSPPVGAQWALPPVPESDIVCHGDPGPWNMVWRDGEAVGLIDWDFAHPAPALHDVAYALDYFAPFRDDADALTWFGFTELPNRPHRIRVFAEAYGLTDTVGLVDAVLARKRATLDHVRLLAELGIEPQRTWISDGYLATAARHIDWAERNRHILDG